MALTPEEERKVAAAIEEAAAAGRKWGLRAALRRTIESRARALLGEDYGAARTILVRLGLEGAAQRMAEMFLPESRRRWEEGLRPTIEGVMEATVEPAEDVLGPLRPENPDVARFLDGYVSELASRLSQTSYDQVMEEIRDAQREGRSVDDAAEKIGQLEETQKPSRARLIARNELQRTSKGASWQQALRSGLVSEKIRREQHDDKVREEHRRIQGERRPIGEAYSNGEQFAGERDINCRGYDEFVVDLDAIGGEE